MSLRKTTLILLGLFLLFTLTATSVDGAAPLQLEVGLSERTLIVYHGGDRLHAYDAAVGEPAHPTPTGSFSIDRIRDAQRQRHCEMITWARGMKSGAFAGGYWTTT